MAEGWTRWVLDGSHLVDSTREAYLETPGWGLRPTIRHCSCTRMLILIMNSQVVVDKLKMGQRNPTQLSQKPSHCSSGYPLLLSKPFWQSFWNGLRNVPEHDRIVALRGAIIDTTFSLASPAVLLVMDRLQRDLYVAIKTGLDWLSRYVYSTSPSVFCSVNGLSHAWITVFCPKYISHRMLFLDKT